jgi:solute carrier family 39 (zinc transporter), member 7
MGDVFLHLFPSLYEEVYSKVFETEEEKRYVLCYINGFVFIGLVICYAIEVIINNYFHFGHDHHSHDSKDHEDTHKSSALITIAFMGDMFHNFTDGLAIASTFMLSRKLGIATVLACFFHEIPHEIGDFTFMYKNNCSYFKALSYQLITG